MTGDSNYNYVHHYGPRVRVVVNAVRICYLALSAFALSRTLAYFPFANIGLNDVPRPVQLISEYIPLSAWTALWAVAFVFCLIGIVRPRIWKLRPLMFMCGIWGVSHLLSWLLWLVGSPSGSETAYINGLTHFSYVGVMYGGSFLSVIALDFAMLLDELERQAERRKREREEDEQQVSGDQ